MMDRLKKKYKTARKYVPAPVSTQSDRRERLASSPSVRPRPPSSKRSTSLAAEHGLKADFMRVRALPFTDEVTAFIEKYDQIFVVEMNRDGQMCQLLKIEYPDQAAKFKIGRLRRRPARLGQMGARRHPCPGYKVRKAKTAKAKKVASKKTPASKPKKPQGKVQRKRTQIFESLLGQRLQAIALPKLSSMAIQLQPLRFDP